MKKNILPFIVTVLSVILVLNSCKKTDAPAIPGIADSNNSDLTTKVSTSVSGFVVDESNAPVAAAAVVAGTKTTTTDANGYFEIKNVSLVANAAVVSVSKTGFFNGIKTWIAANGKSGFFRIKLLAKTSAGTVSGTTGGTVTLTNGLKIAFPASAFVNASTNAAYTGAVTVNAKWIDPTSAELNSIMPGDLRGKDAAGGLKALTTYGMSATELIGSAGELLQIASGKKATITFPIPSSISGTAPATIPLWVFDETNGLWKEEGSAIKTGSTYVGDVSHFSFWNCDVPNTYVYVDVTVNDAGGRAVQNAYVKITNLANNVSGYGYTNAEGYVAGAVPPNTQFLLQVMASPACSFVLQTQNFSTANANISLGTISLLSNRTVNLFGTVSNCNNGLVTNGRVQVLHDNVAVYVNTDTAGKYNVSLAVCSGTTITTSITAVDLTALTAGTAVSSVYQAGSSTMLNLQACGSLGSGEFLTYVYNNTLPVNYIVPADSIKQSGGLGLPQGIHYVVKGQRIPNTRSTLIEFDAPALAVGQTYTASFFNDTQTTVAGATLSNLVISITEAGPIFTGYIAGTYSGTLTTPNNVVIPASGSFRFHRNY